MPEFKQLDGQTLQLGKKGAYLQEDEKAFTLMLDKQFRAADLSDTTQVGILAFNVNTIADILKLGRIPEDGIIDEEVGQAFQYFIDNRDLFIEHGITEHINAKKLEQLTESVYTEAEAANIPTIEDMKKLEVDIGQLYTDEGTSQV
tara:strand:+ start:75 stop:512 length:438 start_codon:yes stop_codon:yes gene_type:complete